MLAGADMLLEIDGAALRLRPSLRAALRLERRPGGLAGLFDAIGEGSVTALAAIVSEGAGPDAAGSILAPSAEPWAVRYARLAPALAAFILDVAEVDPSAADKAKVERPGTGKRLSRVEALEELFGTATGILHWSPADAWSATPAEIRAAFQMHVRVARAQAGLPEIEADGHPLDEKLDSAGLAALKAMAEAA